MSEQQPPRYCHYNGRWCRYYPVVVTRKDRKIKTYRGEPVSPEDVPERVREAVEETRGWYPTKNGWEEKEPTDVLLP